MNDKLTLSLLPWQAKLLLEAASDLEAKWRRINESSRDEDEVAEIGNDLMDLISTREHLEKEAVKAFGQGVCDFSRKTPR
jgi:hypothetical protein